MMAPTVTDHGLPQVGVDQHATATATGHHRELTVDLHHALLTATARLADDFAGTYGRQTIERLLHSSYDRFAAHSTIPDFLPLIAEKFARRRLHAMAGIEGPLAGRSAPPNAPPPTIFCSSSR